MNERFYDKVINGETSACLCYLVVTAVSIIKKSSILLGHIRHFYPQADLESGQLTA